MARLSYLDVANVVGPLGDVLRTRPSLNLYRILPHAPEAALGFLALGRALRTQTSIDPALPEVAILRVGALCDARYEVHQHRRVARGAGLSDDRGVPSAACDRSDSSRPAEAPSAGWSMSPTLIGGSWCNLCPWISTPRHPVSSWKR